MKVTLLSEHWAKELLEADMEENLLRCAGGYTPLRQLYQNKRRDTSLKNAFNCVAADARKRTLDCYWLTTVEIETLQFKIEV